MARYYLVTNELTESMDSDYIPNALHLAEEGVSEIGSSVILATLRQVSDVVLNVRHVEEIGDDTYTCFLAEQETLRKLVTYGVGGWKETYLPRGLSTEWICT